MTNTKETNMRVRGSIKGLIAVSRRYLWGTGVKNVKAKLKAATRREIADAQKEAYDG